MPRGHYKGYGRELERIWSERSIGLTTREISGLFPGVQDVDTDFGASDHPV